MSDSIKVRKIGKYILQRQIGQGSMGTIWLSHHMGLDIPVAVKLLRTSLVDEDPEYIERFIQEGNVAGTIHHKNIIRIFDAGHQGKAYYMVMEYVDGGNAQEMIDSRGCLTPDEVLEFGIVITDALIEAHGHNIIHRDIKPENIMVTKQGRIKLADLGLAKSTEDSYSSTIAGAAIGTPNYISPEQVKNSQEADHRCDIYSLGATLYHMLTGKVPFEGESNYVVMNKHCEEELVPPQEIQEGLPIPLCKAICKMMEKDPNDRFQNCEEINELLNKYKYSSEHTHVVTGKTQVTLEKIDLDELKERRRKARAKQTEEKAAKNKKLMTIALAAFIVLIFAVVALKSIFGSSQTIEAKSSIAKKEQTKTISKKQLTKPDAQIPQKKDGTKTKVSKPITDKPSNNEDSADVKAIKLQHLLHGKGEDLEYSVSGDTLTVIKKSKGSHAFLTTKQKFKDYKIYMIFRYLEPNGFFKLGLYRKKKTNVDILLRNKKKPHSGSISFRNIDYKLLAGDYTETEKVDQKVLVFNSNLENPLKEWNKLFVLKHNKKIKVYVNTKEIGSFECDLEESAISLTFWHPNNVEFQTFNLTEITQ